MSYLLFIGLICASILLVILGIFILKPKLNKEFMEDKLVKTDNLSFAIFELDKEYHEYLTNYKIFKYGKKRFLTLIKNKNIDYIEYSIVCYKDDKFLETIKVKDTNIRKNEEYVIKLPDNASSFKVLINQINETVYDTFDIKSANLFKKILASFLFGIAAILPISLIEIIVFKSYHFENYPSDEEVINFMFNKLSFYIVMVMGFGLVFIISLILLIILNKNSQFKFKENNESLYLDNDINELFNFDSKIKFDSYNNSNYFKVKGKYPKDLIDFTLIIQVFDENNKEILSIDKYCTKKEKLFKIKKEDDFAYLEFKIKKARFKKYHYNNEEFEEYPYVNNDGSSAKKLGTFGVPYSLISYLLIFFISIGGVITSNNTLSPYKDPSNIFKYEFINEAQKEDGITISGFYLNSSKMYIPKTINGYEVKEIKEKSFQDNGTITKVGFGNEISILSAAFMDAKTLKEVDFKNVIKIGKESFKNTNLREINIKESTIKINENAFENIQTLSNLTFESSIGALTISNFAFKGSKVNGDIIIKRKLSISNNSFNSLNFQNCYVYETQTILGKNNYKSYFNSQNVYFLSECIHDHNSFIESDGNIDKEFKAELISTTPGTCIDYEIQKYKCFRCKATFEIKGEKDLNNHHYEDGKCIWCGKKE